MTTEEEVAQAIQTERERRDYHVTVSQVRRTWWVAETPISDRLEGYSALTECTEHEPSCTWADFAFRIGGSFKVVLQNDLLQRSAIVVLVELEEEATQAR